MKKKEIIATHQLVHLIAGHINETHEEFDCSEYNELPVGAKSLHKPKGEHEEAVSLLLDAITETIAEEADSTTDKKEIPV